MTDIHNLLLVNFIEKNNLLIPNAHNFLILMHIFIFEMKLKSLALRYGLPLQAIMVQHAPSK